MSREEWFEHHGLDRDDGEPIVVVAEEETLFQDTLDYIESWPDKHFSFLEKFQGEPWLEEYLEQFRAFASKSDKDGPAFEEWR